MGNVLSRHDSTHRHALSKISDQDINIQNFTQLLVDDAAWSAALVTQPLGRPTTIRIFYNVTNAITVSFAWSPDHTATAFDKTAPHWFTDTAGTHNLTLAAGAQGTADIPGADLLKITPSVSAGTSTIMIVALYY
jgi:hypothetical protein